jgi:hypothetical protein
MKRKREKMSVEIIEFYPLKRDEKKGLLTGTIRIKLVDLGLHILGVYVDKRKDLWHFWLPGRTEISNTTGERVRFPFISFEDREQQQALIKALRQQAPAFIEKRISDTEKPIIWPQEPKTWKR